MDDQLKDLACWLVDQYEIYCADYNNPNADFRSLYRSLCEVVGMAISELDHLGVEMTDEEVEEIDFEVDEQLDDDMKCDEDD